MKGDHRIFRYEKLRILFLQRQLYFLAKKESRVRHPISHFDEILDRHLCNGVGVDLSRILELLKNELPVSSVAVKYLKQASTVFETAIQSLAKERNNRVSSVA